ncbi:929_t:CDS:2 [Acaulospora morrowiae]|uniref:929_t:CDS:1 n=1 Tax=Acaulospora morrowiae TaxID=94023 RepID=A0A9N8VCJ7_9GLOM|nr:929_t:CDS:2 [Acaulospora morrowiae]
MLLLPNRRGSLIIKADAPFPPIIPALYSLYHDFVKDLKESIVKDVKSMV